MQLLLKTYPGFLFALLALFTASCNRVQTVPAAASFKQDSLQVEALIKMGDSIYAERSGMASIAESLIYFDSANRMAQRLGDTLLLANTLFYIGNVYNAWNREPLTTIDYYQRSLNLYNRLPKKRTKAFYVRYILAHAWDPEKAADSTRCVQTLQAALTNLQHLPDSQLVPMIFIPDFAWVASNVGAYSLADSFLKMVPRYRIVNDPNSNNYLDHYYLTRARMDVWGQGRKASPYLDSLRWSLATCGNRYDSAYYSRNLSALYESSGNDKEALRFGRLSEAMSNQLGQSDILSVLRQEVLDRKLQAEEEKQKRVAEQLRSRNALLIGSGIVLALVGLLYAAYRKRHLEAAHIRRQEAFTQQLLQKEEDERRRLATDLHDGVNHELLALKNNLLLQKQVSAADVESVITSVREVSRNLYPALFESVGLSASVQALCERFTAAGFFTTCALQYQPLLTKEQELHIYRIVQEALNNVAKHAGADAAKITITTTDTLFLLEIKDNGVGFNLEKLDANGTSFGLQSMRQRARAIGAVLAIQSDAQGTVIRLTKELRS